MTDQLDLLGYVAPEPEAVDQTERIIGFMRTMASVGADPTLREVAQYIGTDGVLDDPLMVAWRDLCSAGRLVPHSVPLEFEPDRHVLRWRLRDESTEPSMTVSTGPHLWEREQVDAPDVGNPRPTLLLLDATNIGHRIFHGIDPRPLAERFGFALSRWRRAVKPDYAVAVFDGPGDGWRHALWPKYKANRDHDPSKRPSATDWLDMHAECRAAGLRWACVPAVEADDLIASYTAAAAVLGLDVAVVSSDKDLAQLIREEPVQVRTIDPGNGAARDSAAVLKRWGVRPGQLADVLALAGDASDNYSGITGIGPKVAARLVAEHGGVEQLLASANLLPGKLAAKVRAGAEQARLCLRLATLDTGLALPVAIDDARWTRPLGGDQF